jgi:hypothetical protein
MKNLFITLFVVLSTCVFSQKIELQAEIKGLKTVYSSIMTSTENGFISVNPYHIEIYNQENNLLKSKPWSSVSFKEVKYTQKEKKNYIADELFEPFAARKSEEILLIYVYYKPSEGTAKIVEYKFSSNLDFISERQITSIERNITSSKSTYVAAMGFFRSKQSNHFIFAQYTISSKSTGYKHSLEYQILNFDIELTSSGNFILPTYKANIPDYQVPASSVHSMEVLEEGDPIINLGGSLYLLNDNKAILLEIEPSRQINSYKLKQDKNKNIVLIGTYLDKNDSKHTGYVVMRFDKNLDVVSEDYGVFHSDFYLTPTELINKKFQHASANGDELGSKSKGKLIHKNSSILIDAHLNYNGTIHAVFSGFAKYHYGDYSHNISMVEIDLDGEISSEKVFPHEIPAYEIVGGNNRTEALFENEKIFLFTRDYTSNYNSDNEYKPSIQPIGAFESSVNNVLSFDPKTKSSSHKRFHIDNSNTNSLMLKEVSFPVRDYIILQRKGPEKDNTYLFYSIEYE